MTSTPETVLAREFDLSINTGTAETPVWTDIGGITNISPGQNATRTDDTDFDSDGWEQHTVVMRSRTLSVSLNYKEDPDSTPPGGRDPGQSALIDLGDATGGDAKKLFQYASPNGGIYAFKASVDVAWPGGGKTDDASFTADLTLDGKPTYTPAS